MPETNGSVSWDHSVMVRRLFVLVVPAALLTWPPQVSPVPADPFAFFRPAVTVSEKDLRSLDKGDPLVRLLPGHDHQVAVFAAVSVGVDGNRLIAWVRNIVALRKNPLVLAIGRFSTPPEIDDLRALSLDYSDLDAIRTCRPGDCGLKLGVPEIARLQRAIADKPADWKARLQGEFRRLVLERARLYLDSGHAGLPIYADHGQRVALQTTFSAIVGQSAYLSAQLPRFADYLDHYPAVTLPDVESFLYWSKDQIGGKAQVSVTQVCIVRGRDPSQPDAVVAAKQVFTTHYVNGSLSLTTILRGSSESRHYLAYVNRSDVDVLGGFFGGLVRLVMEHRLKSEVPDVLRSLRLRLESGDPPPVTSPVPPAGG
jgi:hypothetical protein